MLYSHAHCVWGIVVAVLGVAPWLIRRFASECPQNINYQNNETILRDELVLARANGTSTSPLSMFLELQLPHGQGKLPVSTPLLMLLPMIWIFYIQTSLLKCVVFVIVQSSLFVLCIGGLYMGTFNTALHESLTLLVAPVCLFPHIALLKVFWPLFRMIHWEAIGYSVSNSLGFIFSMTLIRMGSKYGDLLVLLVLLPLFRFMVGSATRRMAERLMLDVQLNNKDVPVRRDFAWSFHLAIQMVFGTLSRMFVSNIQDWGSYVLFLIVSMFQEVFLRVTIPRQDKVISSIKSFIWRQTASDKPLQSSMVSPMSQITGRSSTNGSDISHPVVQKDVEISRKEWYAVVLVGEMISEYVGIFANLGLLIIFSDAILVQPFPAFNLETTNLLAHLRLNRSPIAYRVSTVVPNK